MVVWRDVVYQYILLNTGHVGFFPGCQSWKNGNPFMEKNTKDFCGDFTGLFGGGTLLFPSETQESGC